MTEYFFVPILTALFFVRIRPYLRKILKQLNILSERALFEILPKGINKGVVIEKLAEYLGIDKKMTIAIGDYNNDVAMLKKAGVGIAVANASPEALAAADIVTVSNEEHAIARVICDIEEGKIL